MSPYEEGKVTFCSEDVLVRGKYNGTATVKIIECSPSKSFVVVVPPPSAESHSTAQPLLRIPVDTIPINDYQQVNTDERYVIGRVLCAQTSAYWSFVARFGALMVEHHKFEDMVMQKINDALWTTRAAEQLLLLSRPMLNPALILYY
ncbi:hypothetical protein K466DRAFT_606570 [Polyporus arcularius HHB13444]|uniref:Uncharacterized protein n=1 Tax=Polyporus arcularius HHB13444 TaxID=1314778 RepID=A0A5C3NQ88_9APHY|nr:hypothetical protein K466DRAFT_606570 [Polyporus arcularius HHB13444]